MTNTSTPQATLRGAIYTRQSHDPLGQGMAVTRQEERGRKMLGARDVEVVAVLCDNDLSASGSVVRPDFERLIGMIERREINFVWALRFDRLARNQKEGTRLLQAAYEAGVWLEFDHGTSLNLSDPMARAFAEIMLSFAALEVGIKGQRQRLANGQRAKLGQVRTASPRPFGWLPDRTTPHPVEGPAVADAYATILGGGSVRSIVAKWNADPQLTNPQRRLGKNGKMRGQVWRTESVKGVLTNTHHAGLTSIDGEVLGKGDWKPLVAEDTFLAVRAVLRDASRSIPRGVKSLLGGLALCPCGESVTAAKNARGKPSYRHQRPAGFDDGGAYHVARTAEPIDVHVVSVALELCSAPDAAERIVDRRRPDLTALRERREALMAKAEELARDYYAMRDPALTRRRFDAASTELNDQVAQIDASLNDARKVNVLGPLVTATDITATWKAMHVDQQRAALRELFASITLAKPGMGRREFDPASVHLVPREF
ncbi:MAG: recombinase family protein [Stackebrandtia sp.]